MKKSKFISNLAREPKGLLARLLWGMTVLPLCIIMIDIARCFGGVTLSRREQFALQAGLVSTATANPILTTMAVQFMNDISQFVGTRLAPIFQTGERSANYAVGDIGDQVSVPRLKPMAPGSTYGRTNIHLGEDTYFCKKYGHEVPVADETVRQYGGQLKADKAAVNRDLLIIRMNHELRVHDAATDVSRVPHGALATKWNQSGSTPIKDFSMMRGAIRSGVGRGPDTVIVPWRVWEVLRYHEELRSFLGEVNAIKMLTLEQFAKIIEIPNVIIPGGFINAAADGQAVSIAEIWGDSVVAACTSTKQDLEALNFLRTFVWTAEEGGGEEGIVVKSYREENANSTVHQIHHFTDEKMVAATAGYLLPEVLA